MSRLSAAAGANLSEMQTGCQGGGAKQGSASSLELPSLERLSGYGSCLGWKVVRLSGYGRCPGMGCCPGMGSCPGMALVRAWQMPGYGSCPGMGVVRVWDVVRVWEVVRAWHLSGHGTCPGMGVVRVEVLRAWKLSGWKLSGHGSCPDMEVVVPVCPGRASGFRCIAGASSCRCCGQWLQMHWWSVVVQMLWPMQNVAG
eukprot:363341-Chlamydomonas_euryale.AAC.3